MRQTYRPHTLHTHSASVSCPVITVEDGLIVDITSGPPTDSREFFTASFLDVHVHGALGHDFMHASLKEMEGIGRFLGHRGVGHYLPTTITSELETTYRALEQLARFIAGPGAEDAAKPLGIHLEGPFLCPAKRGVHPLQQLLAPSIELFDRFQEIAQGTIRLLTVAPEMPGALELIEHAVRCAVRVSLGHSNATAAETELAIRAGALSATHTFNAMRAPDHREPGIAGAVLDSDEIFAEAIVDGVHLHPTFVRLWFRMKGEQRAILMTDGMSATGMPDGVYKLGDLVVEVRDGVCLSDGVLAGSVLTMEKAVSNFCHFTGASVKTGVRLASHNPAQMLGVEQELAMTPGAPANFNIYDEAGLRCGTILQGIRLPVPLHTP